MKHILAKTALLPDGWASDVLLLVDDQGVICDVSAGQPTFDKERALILDGVTIPAMPNLHSHAFQYSMAGLAEYKSGAHDSFWTWRKVMYEFLENLTPESLHEIAYDLCTEMLRAGYGWVGEFHYIHHDEKGQPYDDPARLSHEVIAAAKRANIGITHLPVLYACSGFGGMPPEEGQKRFIHEPQDYLDLLRTLRSDYQDDYDVRIGCAFHSLRAVTPEMMKEVLSEIQSIDDKMPIHIHISEQMKEVNDCLEWSGKRPIEWLVENFDVNERWCLVHATHMTEDETNALAKSGAVAGLCPVTEANLGDGLFPLGDFMKAGGSWGIGSDSHISVDMVEELRWLEYGQRLFHQSRTIATTDAQPHNGRYLYEQSLHGGSLAMGGMLGRIEKGYKADLISLNGDEASIDNPDILLDQFVFTRKIKIGQVIRNGALLSL